MKTLNRFREQWSAAHALNPEQFAEIQRDAREGMVPVEDLKPLINQILLYEKDTSPHNWQRLGFETDAVHAKHPNLFTT